VAYATGSDIENRVGTVQYLISTDRDGDGIADPLPLAKALQDATDEIDSYVAVRYTLPLSTVPDILVRLCVDIAYYRLSCDASSGTDEKRRLYEDAVKFLKDLVADKATLGVLDPNARVDEIVQVSTTTREFTREKLGSIL
jgi:phage gp36-like protein